MSATSDAFARFLDVVANSLDDHATSGDVLAERVHLSRFLFDRLASAAAGEPPAAFRRRVLLERAAFRLVTTDEDVLPVALEAGYGGMIAHVLTFAAHRRTLVCGALLDAGVSDLGSGDPMRWVAQPV